MFAKKVTKVYRDGKLVNTIKTSMSKKKYHEDLAKTITGAQSSGDKVKLRLGSESQSASGKVDGLKRTGFRTLGGKSVKYSWDSSYTFPVEKSRKGNEHVKKKGKN